MDAPSRDSTASPLDASRLDASSLDASVALPPNEQALRKAAKKIRRSPRIGASMPRSDASAKSHDRSAHCAVISLEVPRWRSYMASTHRKPARSEMLFLSSTSSGGHGSGNGYENCGGR